MTPEGPVSIHEILSATNFTDVSFWKAEVVTIACSGAISYSPKFWNMGLGGFSGGGEGVGIL